MNFSPRQGGHGAVVLGLGGFRNWVLGSSALGFFVVAVWGSRVLEVEGAVSQPPWFRQPT